MKRRRRAICGVTLLTVAVALLLCPGLPWSARWRHTLSRAVVKVEMKVSAWQGEMPRLVCLSGRIINRPPNKDGLKGVQVEALDSTSGWASLTDSHGQFLLRDVTWYPGATYKLIVEANPYQVEQLSVSTSADYPKEGSINLGELSFDSCCMIDAEVLPGRNSINLIDFDVENLSFYRRRFEELTEGRNTDEAKIDAINRFVSTKLDLTKDNSCYESPRVVLENGTAYCGKLALALATLAEAADYRSRLLDLIDGGSGTNSHMVVEIYYGDRWHLYDSTSGTFVRTKPSTYGYVASYKDLRLAPTLASFGIPDHLPSTRGRGGLTNEIYQSGLHHYYYLSKSR